MYETLGYDPGIFGFVKGHRHHTGPTLIMSSFDGDDSESLCIFWVRRCHHAATPVHPSTFSIIGERTRYAAERLYDIHLQLGPPPEALPDFQRERVYQWEEDNIFPGFKAMSFRACRQFLSHVWQHAGKGPEPELTTRLRIETAISFSGLIHLPKKDRNFFWRQPVILHEVGHELEFPHKHGPAFVQRYISLCVRFLGMDKRNLTESAKRYGVAY